MVFVENAIKSADIIVLLVDHTPFKSINLELLSGKQIVDTRGIWS
jgi:UDP-N-acetyl-D-mannosaminuronic acid dehydrogenase